MSSSNQPCDEPCKQPGICGDENCPQRKEFLSILDNKTIDELKQCLKEVNEFLQLGGNDEEIEGMRSVLPFLEQIIKSKEELV